MSVEVSNRLHLIKIFGWIVSVLAYFGLLALIYLTMNGVIQ